MSLPSQATLIQFAEALRSNTHVRVFSLANTRADDPVALAIAKMLRENSSIVSLNIESNYVSGRGVLALVQALPANNTLTELRFHNQRHICGGQAGYPPCPFLVCFVFLQVSDIVSLSTSGWDGDGEDSEGKLHLDQTGLPV